MKAVLVIEEMPKGCGLCPYWRYIEAMDISYCTANFNLLKSIPRDVEGDERHEWCPLRPLPEKNTWDVTPNGHITEFAEGWNACIDEIKGED